MISSGTPPYEIWVAHFVNPFIQEKTKGFYEFFMCGYIYVCICTTIGFSVALVVKNPPVNAGAMSLGFDPWIGKIPWRRAWQPTLVFLPGESHGQRSLAGYSHWDCKSPT